VACSLHKRSRQSLFTPYNNLGFLFVETNLTTGPDRWEHGR
jgi:hypothetical protein